MNNAQQLNKVQIEIAKEALKGIRRVVWMLSKKTKKKLAVRGSEEHPSAPGEAPRKRTGFLKKNITYGVKRKGTHVKGKFGPLWIAQAQMASLEKGSRRSRRKGSKPKGRGTRGILRWLTTKQHTLPRPTLGPVMDENRSQIMRVFHGG